MSIDAARLQTRLTELAAKHQVVGAAVGVLAGGEVTEAAYGVLNVDTGVETTTDSVFQIGSITKVYTATLVMQYVDDGVLDLDEPLVTYLPEFKVGDPDVTKQVTLRQMLSHSCGIDGDHFHDTGRGDDCLEKYLESCAELEQKHPIGATMSYCNAGYNMVGRLLERISEQTWDDVLRNRLIEPLGLTHTMTLPEEVLRFRGAMGHMGEPGEAHIAPVWGLPRSNGPAGLICATTADVLAFAKLHLDDGVGPDGKRLLSPQAAATMREPQIEIPDRWVLGDSWGVGWILMHWDERLVYGHDGSTLGQNAYLRIVPDAGVGVVMLTNGGGVSDLFQELYTELLHELADIRMPARPAPPATASTADLSPYAGTYRSSSVTLEFEPRPGGVMHCTMTNTTELAAALDDPVTELDFQHVEEQLFVGRLPGQETWTPLVFFTLDDGTEYVHLGVRATQKVT